jgi:hypothetical protein
MDWYIVVENVPPAAWAAADGEVNELAGTMRPAAAPAAALCLINERRDNGWARIRDRVGSDMDPTPFDPSILVSPVVSRQSSVGSRQ